MNCPPATSRLAMGTLHQVQSRSGNSARWVGLGEGEAGLSVMGGILAKGLRVCQCTS
ncbi:MAG: hypothetical protein NBKEAIPA_02998 [Nitrospirae bacterium]|nr:MAG: hypothetical protein UZ03_NOB001000349 [Nitrospira sp. OLB3]MBV6471071.1 hypothetical protein [Nitrospirota bacterium]